MPPPNSGFRILFGTVVLALIGCASAPSNRAGNAQLATASLALFHPSALPAQAAYEESLCAPIALYPNPLLAQVFMAADHESEIATAAHWIRQHPRAQLGDEITLSELHRQPWDPSVESLLVVPDVLVLMNAPQCDGSALALVPLGLAAPSCAAARKLSK